MNRDEYLRMLRYSLTNMPSEEVDNIIEYYLEYFADAGEENEQKVIEELGTPQNLAAKVVADYYAMGDDNQKHNSENGQSAYGSQYYNDSYSNTNTYNNGMGYNTGNAYNNGMGYNTGNAYNSGMGYNAGNAYNSGMGYNTGNAYNNGMGYNAGNAYNSGMGYNTGTTYNNGNYNNANNKHKRSSGTTALFVVLAVITSPVWFSLLIAFISVVFSIAIAIVAVVGSLGIAAISLCVAGVCAFGIGIYGMITFNVPTGVMLMGTGLLMAGIGLLLAIGVCTLAVLTGRLFRFIFRKCKEVYNNRKGRAHNEKVY